jgi:hypothetical protein
MKLPRVKNNTNEVDQVVDILTRRIYVEFTWTTISNIHENIQIT